MSFGQAFLLVKCTLPEVYNRAYMYLKLFHSLHSNGGPEEPQFSHNTL